MIRDSDPDYQTLLNLVREYVEIQSLSSEEACRLSIPHLNRCRTILAAKRIFGGGGISSKNKGNGTFVTELPKGVNFPEREEKFYVTKNTKISQSMYDGLWVCSFLSILDGSWMFERNFHGFVYCFEMFLTFFGIILLAFLVYVKFKNQR